MYRIPVCLSGHVLLLLGALLGGPAAAGSTTFAALDEVPAALLSASDALSLQGDLHRFRGINASDTWSITRTQALSFDAAFGVDASVAITSLELPTAKRFLPAQGIATSPHSIRKLPTAENLDTAPPMPTALWILGTGMIGLSAVGRRRAQPLPVAS